MFNPERANRLVEYHARDSGEPSLPEVIEATLASTEVPGGATGLTAEVKHAVDNRILEALLALGANPAASAETQATVRAEVTALKAKLATSGSAGEEGSFTAMEVARIDEFLHDPAKFVAAKPVPAPPGMPIGDDEE